MYVSPKRNRALYNPPLIFAYVTCYKSPDNYHALSHVNIDICPSIISIKKKQSQRIRPAQEFPFVIFITPRGRKMNSFGWFQWQRQ